MNRFYAVETMPTPTGAKADHRLALKPSGIVEFARHLGTAVGAMGTAAPTPATAIGESGQKFAAAVTKDLQAHRGRSIVIAGEHQPAEVHALAQAMNQALGNVGATVFHTETAEAEPVDQRESLRALVVDMNAGKVDLLIVLSGNPVFSAPPDLQFAPRLPPNRRMHTVLRVTACSRIARACFIEAHISE